MRKTFAALFAVACLAGVLAPGAAAHANLVRSEPGSGTILARAPREVRLVFDDTVRPASGIRAIRNGDGSVLAGGPHLEEGSSRVLVVPLRPNLSTGDYTVLWRVVSDDGHLIAGVLAFGVGSGRPPPTPALAAGGEGPEAGDILRRFVFFAGVLIAVGGLAFQLFVADGGRDGILVPLVGFALALGASAPDLSPETRFERLDDVAAVAAAAGVAGSMVAFARPRVRPLVVPPALALVVTPTLRGHALDPGQVRALAVGADLVHVAAAAVWIGGLVQLAVFLGLRGGSRQRVVRRFSAAALAAVLLVGVTGIVRAVGELSAFNQLWSTGYGRTLLVKTGLLCALVGLAWLNRRRVSSRSLLRLGVGAELVVLAGVVTAVALLTDLRPGRHAALAAPGRTSSRSSPLRLPPRGGLVLAREAGSLAVALAARPTGSHVELVASILGPDQLGVNGLALTFAVDGAVVAGERCGGGCYSALVPGRPRVVAVRFGAASVRFALPAPWPPKPAAGLVRRAEHAYRSLRTLVLHERLASSPTNAISTVFRFVAPDRMAYQIRGGPAGIVIGSTRWDKASRSAPWVRSAQDRLRQPEPFWSSVSNAYLLRTSPTNWIVSFLDRRTPAWFTATIERGSYRTLALQMTAAAHFMRHRYGPFNAPLSIRPPR